MIAARRLSFPLILAVAALAAAALGQVGFAPGDTSSARQAMKDARKQGEAARRRAEKLERDAKSAVEQVEKTAREAAAVAARIQQTEAEIVAQEGRVRIIAKEREQLQARLAKREQPLIRLTAALQRLSRRPPMLAVLRPGSLRDTMHMRALLETMMPEVRRRTAVLRAEIEKGRALERRAQLASDQLRASEAELNARRQQLLKMETRQRLASRKASGIASREAERSLALAEKARDLGALVAEVGKQAQLRDQLALLPGPILRPPRPEESEVIEIDAFTAPPAGLTGYIMPVSGRLVTGFGARTGSNVQSRGIVLAARPGSQVVSPAPGRVAFAGPYRGYGRIVIIDHEGGWATLITGLAQLNAAVGEKLVSSSPLGVTRPGESHVTVELRQNGDPVNPLQFVSPL
jgi:septal ring factor EnvC (AmiA/AmiB activator)